MLDIERYKPLLHFLSLYLGAKTELLLCDTQKVLYIENPLDGSRTAGMALGEMEQSFIASGHCHDVPYTVNYRAMTPRGERLRSATMFLRDAAGALIGLLTINTQVEQLLGVREVIDRLINGNEFGVNQPEQAAKPQQYYETLSMSVIEMSNSIIDRCIQRFGVPAERLTAEEKLMVVRELDACGTFLIKGSVSEVAKRLFSSEATIYRYLQQINS